MSCVRKRDYSCKIHRSNKGARSPHACTIEGAQHEGCKQVANIRSDGAVMDFLTVRNSSLKQASLAQLNTLRSVTGARGLWSCCVGLNLVPVCTSNWHYKTLAAINVPTTCWLPDDAMCCTNPTYTQQLKLLHSSLAG